MLFATEIILPIVTEFKFWGYKLGWNEYRDRYGPDYECRLYVTDPRSYQKFESSYGIG